MSSSAIPSTRHVASSATREWLLAPLGKPAGAADGLLRKRGDKRRLHTCAVASVGRAEDAIGRVAVHEPRVKGSSARRDLDTRLPIGHDGLAAERALPTAQRGSVGRSPSD